MWSARLFRGLDAATFNNATLALVDAVLIASIVDFAQVQARRAAPVTSAEPGITPLFGAPAASIGLARTDREDGRMEVAEDKVPAGAAHG